MHGHTNIKNLHLPQTFLALLKHGKNFTVFTGGDPTHLKDQSFVVTVYVARSLTEKSRPV
jgi:hypothetical protein